MTTLEAFIAIPTIANDLTSNELGINFVKQFLKPIGFKVTTEGESPYHQPVIVAKYTNPKSTQKVVLYGHYDVEKIKDWEQWDTPPFELVEKGGRYYSRGIADNKGILWMRLQALKAMFEAGEPLPNILWIIQGEEEVGGQTPFEIIPKHFESFKSNIYLEETGVYNKLGKPVIFHLPKSPVMPDFLTDLNNAIYNGEAVFESRCLHKFTKCPFLHSIPTGGHYIGFGPNDGKSNIHRENESLDKFRLEKHQSVFKSFIRWINQTPLATCAVS
jgi:cysteinylglycine-S-conjugate dipeptidase